MLLSGANAKTIDFDNSTSGTYTYENLPLPRINKAPLSLISMADFFAHGDDKNPQRDGVKKLIELMNQGGYGNVIKDIFTIEELEEIAEEYYEHFPNSPYGVNFLD